VTTDRPTFTHTETGTAESRWRERPEWEQVAPVQLATTAARRLIVVAAHPDDETLGAGGLTAQAARAGLDVVVVLVTDGEASHPESPTSPREALARQRVEESRAALARLAPSGTLVRLGVPDGAVVDHATEVVDHLVDLIGERGEATLVVAPWRHDGHGDHDATGRAAGVACRRTDALLWEYPIWLWHWCEPADAPWAQLRTLGVPADVQDLKREAVSLHRTQVAPLSDRPGDETVLHAHVLTHFDRPYEVFLPLDAPSDDALDDLHESSADPWKVRTSWYEKRKRAVTLASLPRERYSRALEVGGSVGALAAELAGRVDDLVVVDESRAATDAAHSSLGSLVGVEVVQGSVPEDWPAGHFDLVVVSEVGYFLSPARLRRLVVRVESCLTDGGAVVLCHWRHPVRGWPMDGPAVHRHWSEWSDVPRVATHVEDDFRLDVFSRTEAHRAGAS